MSIVTAALDGRVKNLGAYYPALSDVTGYLFDRAGGWPHYFEKTNKEYTNTVPEEGDGHTGLEPARGLARRCRRRGRPRRRRRRRGTRSAPRRTHPHRASKSVPKCEHLRFT